MLLFNKSIVYSKFLDQLCDNFGKIRKRSDDQEAHETDSLDPATEKIKLETDNEIDTEKEFSQ